MAHLLLVSLPSSLPAVTVTGFGESWFLDSWGTLRSGLGVFWSDINTLGLISEKVRRSLIHSLRGLMGLDASSGYLDS